MEMPEIETVPVIRLDDLTDEQRRAYMLVHNKLTMNTDFDLDVLDGSPPCSTFSTAGSREKAWGKEKNSEKDNKNKHLMIYFLCFWTPLKS